MRKLLVIVLVSIFLQSLWAQLSVSKGFTFNNQLRYDDDVKFNHSMKLFLLYSEGSVVSGVVGALVGTLIGAYAYPHLTNIIHIGSNLDVSLTTGRSIPETGQTISDPNIQIEYAAIGLGLWGVIVGIYEIGYQHHWWKRVVRRERK